MPEEEKGQTQGTRTRIGMMTGTTVGKTHIVERIVKEMNHSTRERMKNITTPRRREVLEMLMIALLMNP